MTQFTRIQSTFLLLASLCLPLSLHTGCSSQEAAPEVTEEAAPAEKAAEEAPKAEAPAGEAAQGKTTMGNDCVRNCRVAARDAFTACKDGGADEDTCRAQVRETVNPCMEACSAENFKNGQQDCQTTCGLKAREAFRACVEEGGDRDACGTTARGAMPACTAECEAGEAAE